MDLVEAAMEALEQPRLVDHQPRSSWQRLALASRQRYAYAPRSGACHERGPPRLIGQEKQNRLLHPQGRKRAINNDLVTKVGSAVRQRRRGHNSPRLRDVLPLRGFDLFSEIAAHLRARLFGGGDRALVVNECEMWM
jgi:hypothetical protein